MIHYSCDLCHRRLEPGENQRYVVKIEVIAAMDQLEDFDQEDDRDHLLELHDALEQIADPAAVLYEEMQFDLCAECRRKYAKNPLGRRPAKQFDFSKN